MLLLTVAKINLRRVAVAKAETVDLGESGR
jgi:hypothetical protein